MSSRPTGRVLPAVDAVLGAAPQPLVVPGARERIRRAHLASGSRIAVLDDDPTGSQSVADVAVVWVPDPAAYAAALADPGSTCFVLTNARSLPAAAAAAANRTAGRALWTLARRLGAPLEVVSRSDSTLRGHLLAEVGALDAARREATGRGYDRVLLVPAYLEAGRLTAGDVHWARVDGRLVPVGTTEFARDASFGYAASDLREFLAEKAGVPQRDVGSLTLPDIRLGGPERVAAVLDGVDGGRYVVVNATEYADLEVVVLGLLAARARGRTFLYRTGPSFVRALTGQEPRPPVTAAQIWPDGPPQRHGLVVVGSHVGLTTRQVAVLRAGHPLAAVDLDVARLDDARRRGAHVADAAARVTRALARSDVLLVTSRTQRRGADEAGSLRIARTVSGAVADVVRRALPARPGWVVAKGGITAHDVAVGGLGIRRATVLGQLFPGAVSVLRPVAAAPEAVGMPYVVFPGNVGDEGALAAVVERLHGT